MMACQSSAPRHPSVIDQNINGADMLFNVMHRCLHRVCLRHIEIATMDLMPLATQLISGSTEFVLISGIEHHSSTCLRQTPSQSKTDTP
jgi:hypothetical protein